MHDKPDPVDRALRSLRSSQWTGDAHNTNLEEKLMKEFRKNGSSSFVSRHRALVTALAVVLVGGAGFAAAGGTDVIKNLFVTLQITGPDGETQIFDAILEPVEDGGQTATMNLNVGDGQEATLTLEKVPSDDADSEMAAITVELDGPDAAAAIDQGGEVTITTSISQEPNDALIRQMQTIVAGQSEGRTRTASFGRTVYPVVLDEIQDSVFSQYYEDKNGLWQELSVVAENAGDIESFSIYTTFSNEQGETQYRRIGSMVGVDPKTTTVAGVDWDDSGVATINFSTNDGSQISLKVDPYDREDRAATMTFTKEDGSIGVVDLKKGHGQKGSIQTIQIRRDADKD